MSPEQAGDEPLDHRSDLYSAACVICEMLCGKPPFASRTAQATMSRRLTEEPCSLRTVRPSISVGVDDVLRKALSRLPADRFQSAEEMSAALRRGALEPGGGELTPSPAPVEPKIGKLTFWEEMRRRKVWSSGAIYSSVCLGLIGLIASLKEIGILSTETTLQLALAVLGIAAVGLPATLALAWMFDLTRDRTVQRTGAWDMAEPSSTRWPLLTRGAIVAILVLAALVTAWVVLA